MLVVVIGDESHKLKPTVHERAAPRQPCAQPRFGASIVSAMKPMRPCTWIAGRLVG